MDVVTHEELVTGQAVRLVRPPDAHRHPAIVIAAGWNANIADQFDAALDECHRFGLAACSIDICDATRWHGVNGAVRMVGEALDSLDRLGKFGNGQLLLAGHSFGSVITHAYSTTHADDRRVIANALIAPPIMPLSEKVEKELLRAWLAARFPWPTWPLRAHTARAWTRASGHPFTAADVLASARVASDVRRAIPSKFPSRPGDKPAMVVLHKRDERFPITSALSETMRFEFDGVVTIDGRHTLGPAGQAELARHLVRFSLKASPSS